MTAPEAQLTFSPDPATPVLDGVLYVVTGPVLPRARIELTDGDGRVRGVSPEFSQRNKLSSPGDAQAFVLSLTGSPTHGDFTLDVFSQLQNTDFGATGA